MEDREIIAQYFSRDPCAIDATAARYGSYCTAIALNILGSTPDAEECVNDAFLKTWNSIPPQHPLNLRTYLGKIVRNLAFDRYRYRQAEKRRGSEMTVVLDELAECVVAEDTVEEAIDRQALIGAINAFLRTLPDEKRRIFLCRYWYALPVSQIAARFGRTENYVSVMLSRLRGKLREYLIKGGFDV